MRKTQKAKTLTISNLGNGRRFDMIATCGEKIFKARRFINTYEYQSGFTQWLTEVTGEDASAFFFWPDKMEPLGVIRLIYGPAGRYGDVVENNEALKSYNGVYRLNGMDGSYFIFSKAQ